MEYETVEAVNALLNTVQLAVLVALLAWVTGHRNGRIRSRSTDDPRGDDRP